MTASVDANCWHKRYARVLRKAALPTIKAEVSISDFNGVSLLSTVSEPARNNCYSVSPFMLLAGYAKDEIPKIDNRLFRGGSRLLLWLVTPLLTVAKFHQVQTLNNQCLSTNVYGKAWQNLNVESVRKMAVQQQPHLPVMLRSLNAQQHSALISHLRADNWLPVVTRQVYLQTDWDEFSPNSDVKKDLALLNDTDWVYRSIESYEECATAERLYNQLYIEKYSPQNIRFTAKFLYEAAKEKVIQLTGLLHQGEMVGVLGWVEIEGTLVCPVLGYDTSRPVSWALYRRLTVYSLKYAWDNRLFYNRSAGAPQFKMNRLAKSEIEYSFVNVSHLRFYQRWVWRGVSFLTLHVYRRLLQRFKL